MTDNDAGAGDYKYEEEILLALAADTHDRYSRTEWSSAAVNGARALADLRRRLGDAEAKAHILDGMWVHAEDEVEAQRATIDDLPNRSLPPGEWRAMTKGAFDAANERLAAAESRADKAEAALRGARQRALNIARQYTARAFANAPDRFGLKLLRPEEAGQIASGLLSELGEKIIDALLSLPDHPKGA